MTFPKKVTKDMTIAGTKVTKGNIIIFPVSWKRYNDNFINAKEFRPERFEEEVPSLERFNYVPFYEGKRKCLGYILAQMNMNLLIGYFLDKFEVKVDKDYKINMAIDAVYNCSNPIIGVKLRTE